MTVLVVRRCAGKSSLPILSPECCCIGSIRVGGLIIPPGVCTLAFVRSRQIIILLFLAISACRGADEPASGAADGIDFLRCADLRDDGVKETIRIPPLTLVRDGLGLTIQGLKSTLVTVGLLSGISEASKSNAANLEYFLSRFKEAGVQLIAVVGGLGTTEAQMDGVLQKLATAPVPILLVPGAEENADIFRALTTKRHLQFPQLVDMTRVRRVQVGKLTLVSLPGSSKPFYLGAGERGCGFDQADLLKTAELFSATGTNVLLSPMPPRGSGEWAVDRSRAEVNIGDIALRNILQEKTVKFGLFGRVVESGGNAVESDGHTPAPAGIWSASLWIQAGAAEALPVFLAGEGRAAGMAQIVSFSSDRARYQTLTAPIP